jgi:hypothetical protein
LRLAENAVSSRRDSDSKRGAIWLVRWICDREGHGTRARTSRTAAWARHRPTDDGLGELVAAGPTLIPGH